jgi:DNA-binding transcriptional ArsR family regulator
MVSIFCFPSFFKAIGNPVRQKIVNLLHEKKEIKVKNLVDELNLSQSTVSHHLAVLKKAGIVQAREDGVETYYSICCETIANCCSKMKKHFK